MSHSMLQERYLSRISRAPVKASLVSSSEMFKSAGMRGMPRLRIRRSISAVSGNSSSMTRKMAGQFFSIMAKRFSWPAGSFFRTFSSMARICGAVLPKMRRTIAVHAAASKLAMWSAARLRSGVSVLIQS